MVTELQCVAHRVARCFFWFTVLHGVDTELHCVISFWFTEFHGVFTVLHCGVFFWFTVGHCVSSESHCGISWSQSCTVVSFGSMNYIVSFLFVSLSSTVFSLCYTVEFFFGSLWDTVFPLSHTVVFLDHRVARWFLLVQ